MGRMTFALEQLNPRLQEQVRQKLKMVRSRATERTHDCMGAGFDPTKEKPGPAKLPRLPKIPRLSRPEGRLAMQLEAMGLKAVREFRFHPVRRWRFDFAFIEEKLAIEVQGLTKEGGRHQRFKGFESDCKKLIEATLAGWRVLPVTPRMVIRGEAVIFIGRALKVAWVR